jgi:hypothetical protein
MSETLEEIRRAPIATTSKSSRASTRRCGSHSPSRLVGTKPRLRHEIIHAGRPMPRDHHGKGGCYAGCNFVR